MVQVMEVIVIHVGHCLTHTELVLTCARSGTILTDSVQYSLVLASKFVKVSKVFRIMLGELKKARRVWRVFNFGISKVIDHLCQLFLNILAKWSRILARVNV